MAAAGVPAESKDKFLKWAIGSLWKGYTEDRMNQRLIIENEIRNSGLHLPNGTVKKEYLAYLALPSERISDIRLEGIEDLGLSFIEEEPGRFAITGTPVQHGDFTLKLRFRTVDGEAESVFPIPIAFNPDPRSLWRDIKTDPNIPYYKEDSAQQYVKVEGKSDGKSRKDMVAASQRGRSHAQEGKPRDDHFSLYHCDESDWYIMAVADGAGSAKYSRKGAEVACNTVVNHCKNQLHENSEFEQAICQYAADREDADRRTHLTRRVIDIVYNGALKAHEAVKQVAQANGEAVLKDFSTTLMFAICKRYRFGWFIASFWVGDGAMCLYDAENHTAKLLGTPDEGEFSGQTRFLTMPEIFRDPECVSKRLRMAIVPDFTALFLMTDGVSDPMFETDRNLNDYAKWEEFYNAIRTGFPADNIPGVDLEDDNPDAQHQLLNWLNFWSPGNHDDRTLAILY